MCSRGSCALLASGEVDRPEIELAMKGATPAARVHAVTHRSVPAAEAARYRAPNVGAVRVLLVSPTSARGAPHQQRLGILGIDLDDDLRSLGDALQGCFMHRLRDVRLIVPIPVGVNREVEFDLMPATKLGADLPHGVDGCGRADARPDSGA